MAATPHQAPDNDSFPVEIRVDASKKIGKIKEIWRFFGADEPNYATTPVGEKLLGELGSLRPKHVYFRAHNLLTTGDGKPALKWGSTNAYTEDEAGNPIYDWTIVDQIFDSYLKHGLKPYAQIGFMPLAMSTHPEPYRHHWHATDPYGDIYTGWTYPPKDYQKWSELVYQWTKHCVERYGRHEVEQWFWETWNEPNIGYWKGTPEEFEKLHDYAIAGVLRALPTAKVGGPDVAGSGGRFMREFLAHCLHGTNHATGQVGSRLDFVSFHAKGAPTVADGHIRMGISAQLQTIDEAFRILNSFPELASKPVVIGESDPEGCAACQGPSFSYRNGTVYSSYTAAVFARKLDLADKYGINLEGALTWAFTFADQPYFAGFRQLATRGIDLPVLNVFRMYGKMGGERVASESSNEVPLDQIVKKGVRDQPDVGSVATLDGHRLTVMVWHYHEDDIAGPGAAVTLHVAGLSPHVGAIHLTEYRIDSRHSNSYAAWLAMGSPAAPSPEQIKKLEEAGQLARVQEQTPSIKVTGGEGTVNTTLPRQGVSLFELKW
jgi:xylan 1,4-beta-xylosidase